MNYCDETGKETAFRKKLGMVLARGGHGVQATYINPKGEYPIIIQNSREMRTNQRIHTPREMNIQGIQMGMANSLFFEAHPEWYGLFKGKRSDRINGFPAENYCTSNKDATKELAKNLVQSLIDGPWKNVDIANFWMLDVGTWCECENCKKQGILPTG